MTNLSPRFLSLAIAGLVFALPLAASAQKAAKNPAPQKSVSSAKGLNNLSPGANLLGLRVGQKGPYTGSIGIGGNFEHLYTSQFGFGAQVYYSTFDMNMSVGTLNADVDYSAWTFAALAHYHPEFIKVKNFDPFVSVGLAHSFISSDVKMKDGSGGATLPGASLKGDSTYLVAMLTARYFVDQNLGLVGQVGLGNLTRASLGLDYLF